MVPGGDYVPTVNPSRGITRSTGAFGVLLEREEPMEVWAGLSG
jgi:hypothetical protein